jgi:hypothetical protein
MMIIVGSSSSNNRDKTAGKTNNAWSLVVERAKKKSRNSNTIKTVKVI